mmetsp:Transcript_51042/g.110759  ORF Transcript_51042/g.110759 Transcript_51042/m.110759 type:complete len:218 (+) Transcript_51042:802-1455(+)
MLAFKPLLNDLHVEDPQEATSEADAERCRVLRLVADGRVVQTEAVKGELETLVGPCIIGEEAAEDHRHDLCVARQCLDRVLSSSDADRVTDAGISNLLDCCAHVADLADAEAVHWLSHAPYHDAHLIHLEFLLRGHESNPGALLDGAIDNAEHGNDAPVEVVEAIEDEGTQRGSGSLCRWWNTLNHRRDDLRHTLSRLGGTHECLRAVDSEDVLDLF